MNIGITGFTLKLKTLEYGAYRTLLNGLLPLTSKRKYVTLN